MCLRKIFKVSLIGILIILIGSKGISQQPAIQVVPSHIIFPPSDTTLWKDWKNELSKIRNELKEKIGYSDVLYADPHYQWASKCFNVTMLMLFDKRFYDADKGVFNVNAFLQYGIEQFGGYDGVVLWHAYPRIGFDDRNQFDFYKGFPGGLSGLRKLVEQFHKKGAKVFIDYNPWDTGTRREKDSDIDMLCTVIAAINADGIFLDTMDGAAEVFRSKSDKIKKGIVFESEKEVPVTRIKDHHLSWKWIPADDKPPGVLWNKWFERRHLMHMTNRWATDHSSEIQTAWMNGCGMIIWDNIFGSANLYNERDKSILRSMLPVQRRYHSIFSGEGWEPSVQTGLTGVFANKWFNDTATIWTLVNITTDDQYGLLFCTPHIQGTRYYNLLTGRETGIVRGNIAFITDSIRSRGIGAVIAIKNKDITASFNQFLSRQEILYTRYNDDTSRIYSEERQRPVDFTPYAINNLPRDMILIEKTSYPATARFTQRECGFYPEQGKTHQELPEYRMFETISRTTYTTLSRYAIDETPVTNRQYYQFLRATKYKPANMDHFLQHWVNGEPPKDKEDHPVVYVNIDDARAYAKWAGKRLPTEAEWQYAAEGPQHLLYPWGNSFDADRCNNGQLNGITPVKAYPDGRSYFGCYDMCGNTWEWTESERSDDLTRYCIIKGGSYYKATGSHWYTDGGARSNDFSAKFILMNPGLDRCATIGFRCVVDIME